MPLNPSPYTLTHLSCILPVGAVLRDGGSSDALMGLSTSAEMIHAPSCPGTGPLHLGQTPSQLILGQHPSCQAPHTLVTDVPKVTCGSWGLTSAEVSLKRLFTWGAQEGLSWRRPMGSVRSRSTALAATKRV